MSARTGGFTSQMLSPGAARPVNLFSQFETREPVLTVASALPRVSQWVASANGGGNATFGAGSSFGNAQPSPRVVTVVPRVA